MTGVAPSRVTAGVVVVDKPRGPTSHDVVARVRRALGTREVGHAGTLDPLATGVLVIALGEATKLVPYLTAQDKAYRATVRFGVETSSLDEGGTVTARHAFDPSILESDALEDALSIERARTEQIPPMVSAIKLDGVAAHVRVRRGETIEVAPRAVSVRALRVTAVRRDPPEIELEVACAKGYYVRALARDLAASLGTLGHLVALRRLSSGSFTLEGAISGDPIDAGALRACTLPLLDAAARALRCVQLTDDGAIKARHGKRLDDTDFVDPSEFPASGAFAWVHQCRLVAVGERTEAGARVLRGFGP